jgi:DNA-binding winged helix-turn-helix (wHTH) protein/TolB-like protein/Flp pilus assembly protein TadD
LLEFPKEPEETVPPASNPGYRFGPYFLDTQRRLLRKKDQTVPLTPKALDLLTALVERAGVVVDKEDLMRMVWPEQAVEDGNLTVNVSALRKALEERPGDHRYVVTVPGRGYKFASDVMLAVGENREDVPEYDPRTDSAGSPRFATRGKDRLKIHSGIALAGLVVLVAAFLVGVVMRPQQPPSPAQIASLAVLPFKSLVPDARDESLELGLADMVITKLGGIERLVVRPTNLIRRYTGQDQDPIAAGRQLSVDAVLEGTIHRAGDRFRITARLLRVGDGTSIWADHFDEATAELFKIEELISGRIARALHIELAPHESSRVTKHYTASPEAYRLYLAGRYQWSRANEKSWKASVDYFERAVAIDPAYSLAYAGLADAWVSLAADAVPAIEAVNRSRRAATKAIELDETLAEAHVSLGRVKAYYDWDWTGAGREFDRALQLKPNSPDVRRERGLYLATVGRTGEALSDTRRAIELDWSSPMTNFAFGWALLAARRYDETIEHFRKFRDIDPESALAFNLTGLAYLGKHRYGEALAEYNRALEHYPDHLVMKASFGFTCGAAGNRAAAERTLAELTALSGKREVSPYYLAMVHAGLNRDQHAMAELERAYRQRSRRLWALNIVPAWDSLRTNNQFRGLIRRIGLTH